MATVNTKEPSMDFLAIPPNRFVGNHDFNDFGCPPLFEGTHALGHTMGGDFYFNPILLSHQHTEQATDNTQSIRLASINNENNVSTIASDPEVSATMSSRPSQSKGSNFQTGSCLEYPNMQLLASKFHTNKLSRKRGKEKAARNMPEILKPLSELVKLQNSSVLDIESYVTRPECERKDEIRKGKTQGKVKRPLNAFMLYRKVYQKHVKTHYAVNNHKIVSQLCGASWALEPEFVRKKYTKWANIERDYHAKTWPEYKFSPGSPKKKRTGGINYQPIHNLGP